MTFSELICLIILLNNYVFQVSSKIKVDLVITNVPSNLSILHVYEPLSLIPPWSRRMDNFIESIVFFTDRLLFYRGPIIIMHANDLQVLKEIRSFL